MYMNINTNCSFMIQELSIGLILLQLYSRKSLTKAFLLRHT